MAKGWPTFVVFDLGGVLVDWDPRRLYRKLFADPAEMEHFLAEVCTGSWNAQMDRGRPFAEAIAELKQVHPGRHLHIESYFSRWIEMIGGPIQGTVAILEELVARGVPLVALTNWSVETLPLVRHDPTYTFFDHFQQIFVSGELQIAKPDPAIFRHVLVKIGRQADECFFIDDNEENIRAAARLGFRTHRFSDPERLRAVLETEGLLG